MIVIVSDEADLSSLAQVYCFLFPQEVGLMLAAILALLLAFYAFFYLRLSTNIDSDLDPDED